MKLFIPCGGAYSPHPIKLCQRGSDGKRFLWEPVPADRRPHTEIRDPRAYPAFGINDKTTNREEKLQ